MDSEHDIFKQEGTQISKKPKTNIKETQGNQIKWSNKWLTKWNNMTPANKCIVTCTAVIAIATVIYTIVAFFQLTTMKGQLGEMQATTKFNNDSFYAQQKAFVYFEPLTFQTRIDDRIHKRVWDITGKIGNSGNSPTRNLAYNMGCSTDIKDIDKFFNDWSKTTFYFLGPKVIINPMVCTFPTDQITQTFGKKEPIYAYGKAKYQDIIKQETHITEFCYQLVLDMFRAEAPNISAQATPCPGSRSHNCADAECDQEKNQSQQSNP